MVLSYFLSTLPNVATLHSCRHRPIGDNRHKLFVIPLLRKADEQADKKIFQGIKERESTNPINGHTGRILLAFAF